MEHNQLLDTDLTPDENNVRLTIEARGISLMVWILLLPALAFSQASVADWATDDGASSSATVSRPAGVVNGDLLVVGITLEKGSEVSISPPAGWNLIRRTDNSNDAGLATYYKWAGSSEPNTYSFGLSPNTKWCIGISRITGALSTVPIDASAGQADGNQVNVIFPTPRCGLSNRPPGVIELLAYIPILHSNFSP